jgi:hypothetical protein
MRSIFGSARVKALLLAFMTMVQPAMSAEVEIQVDNSPKFDLYKTLDLCGEGFHASKLYAQAADKDLAIALEHMKEKGVNASRYCYVRFYKQGKLKLIDFHPVKFNPGEGLGSPSPDIPSYSVRLDAIRHKVTLGHYVK